MMSDPAAFRRKSYPNIVPSNKRARPKVVHLVAGDGDEGVAIDHFENAVLPPHGLRGHPAAKVLLV